VFEMACANFKLFMDEGLLKKTSESFYVYQQRIDDRAQTGLVAGVSVDEYQRGLIKKHELTRFEKVDERSKYAINVGAHLEPVMIVHRDNQSISELIYKATASDPLYDIIDTDGVRNILWRADNAREIQKEFGKLEALYIADGHHRSEAALIARNALQAENPKHNGSEKYNFYPAVIFAEKELKVYEYDWDGDPPKRPPSRYTIKDVMAYADRSETMPPKSTWFSPKLASGLFVYPLS